MNEVSEIKTELISKPTNLVGYQESHLISDTYCLHKKDASISTSKYDIQFTINALRKILEVVEQQKFNPKDLPVTLRYSIQKLIAFLEVEKQQGK